MHESGSAFPTQTAPSEAGPGTLRRMVLVFTRPAEAFRGLQQSRWSWLVPATLVCLLMSLAPQFLHELQYERQQATLDALIERGVLSEAQGHDARQRIADDAAARGPGRVAQQVLLGLVASLAFRFVLPAALLLAGLRFVLERNTRFPVVLATLSFAALPAGLREILRTPLQHAKGSLDVYFGPAALVGHTRSVGAYALSLLDLFDLWVLALLTVGLAEVTGAPRGRVAGLVVPLWLVSVLLRLGLKATPFGAAF
jgi:hypothetical protein